MKKYIRQMIDDLQGKGSRDFIPPIPKPSTEGPTSDLNPATGPAEPSDLNNQVLSNDPLERVRQLDFQAQADEERENS